MKARPRLGSLCFFSGLCQIQILRAVNASARVCLYCPLHLRSTSLSRDSSWWSIWFFPDIYIIALQSVQRLVISFVLYRTFPSSSCCRSTHSTLTGQWSVYKVNWPIKFKNAGISGDIIASFRVFIDWVLRCSENRMSLASLFVVSYLAKLLFSQNLERIVETRYKILKRSESREFGGSSQSANSVRGVQNTFQTARAYYVSQVIDYFRKSQHFLFLRFTPTISSCVNNSPAWSSCCAGIIGKIEMFSQYAKVSCRFTNDRIRSILQWNVSDAILNPNGIQLSL